MVTDQKSTPHIEEGIERLRRYWPQSHAERNRHGHHLIIVPSVELPKGYLVADSDAERATICTVLFIASPGFPAACPDHFFTDIELRLEHCQEGFANWPKNTNTENGVLLGNLGWPQWSRSQWWSWHLQMWNPSQSSLFTYMKVIEQRLWPAR